MTKVDDASGAAGPGDDFKHLIAFSDLIKRFYELRSDELSRLGPTSGHLKILHFLSDHDGCNQQAIVEASMLGRSTISEVLTQMVGLGFIVREPHGEDRRMTDIKLTKKGWELAGKVRSAYEAFCRENLSACSASDVAAFHRCVRAFVSRSSDK